MNRPANPAGRLDIAAFRLCERVLLPELERRTGLQGIAEQLKPYAEAIIADLIPATRVVPRPPKPRRRLCI